MKVIFLIMIGLSLLRAEYIRDDTNEIVLDTTTNLMWQDDVNASAVAMNWTSAITQCENLNLGGYDDWKLPNVNELYMLADRDRYSPAISPTFQNVINSYYWSSTTYASTTFNAWVVYFNYGYGRVYKKVDNYYVRCVR